MAISSVLREAREDFIRFDRLAAGFPANAAIQGARRKCLCALAGLR